MSIAFVSAGAVGTGTTTVSPGYASSVALGNKLYLVVVDKYPTAGPTAPSGWTLLPGAQVDKTGLANGTNVGDVRTTVYWKIADATDVSNSGSGATISITVTSANASIAFMLCYSFDSGFTLYEEVYTGSAAGPGTTAIDIACSSATAPHGAQVGDMWVGFLGYASSVRQSAEAFVLNNTGSLSAATFATASERADASAAVGQDVSVMVSDATVTTAGGALATPHFTSTAASSQASTIGFAAVVLRLYQVSNSSFQITSGLGQRQTAGFSNTYSAGAWADDIGGACTAGFVQATSGNRPTTTTLPDGTDTALVFNGTTDFVQSPGTGVPVCVVPTGGFRLIFGIFKVTGNATTDLSILTVDDSVQREIFIGGSGTRTTVAGALAYRVNAGAQSWEGTTNLADGNYHRFIIFETASASASQVQIWIDGTKQLDDSTQAAGTSFDTSDGGVGAGGNFWIGHDDFAPPNNFTGNIARVGFAQSSSTFSSTDIANLDAALNNLLQVIVSSDPYGMMGLFGM